MKIKIDHIAKIEGHAVFSADIVNGKVDKARMQVLEGARLLEGILRSRQYYEVSHITARICGVCPVVHTLTSLKALEKAMDVGVSEQTILLRKLLMLGQIINSHALHIFFFSLSDFFDIDNDIKLIQKYPDKTKQAISVRDFGNEIINIIGGRSIHPLTPEVGGFTKLPSLEKIQKIGEMAKKILPEAIKLASFFAKLEYPQFERKTDFISLSSNGEYAIYDGNISINGKIQKSGIPVFMEKIKEFQVSEDAVKRTVINEKPYMVGAIARINNNADKLNPKANKILVEAKIYLPSRNPFHNILGQAVEIVHCLEEVVNLIKKYKNKTIEIIKPLPRPPLGKRREVERSGSGAAAIEAPRGTLFYFYEVGDDGLIKNCNIITPTAQNLARLEEDLKIWLPRLHTPKRSDGGQAQLQKQGLNENEIKNKIKMLIRAYDPCLTCATH